MEIWTQEKSKKAVKIFCEAFNFSENDMGALSLIDFFVENLEPQHFALWASLFSGDTDLNLLKDVKFCGKQELSLENMRLLADEIVNASGVIEDEQSKLAVTFIVENFEIVLSF